MNLEEKLADVIRAMVREEVREQVRHATLDPRLDVADIVPTSLKARVQRAVRTGELKREKKGKRSYVLRSDLEAWMAENPPAGAAQVPLAQTSDLAAAFGAVPSRRRAG